VSASIRALVPELQDAAQSLVDAAGAAGLQPRVTSTLRSYAEQSRLYRRYLSGLSQFPALPPGTSPHEYGWAFDLIVTPFEYLEELGRIWEQEAGGKWGGSRDPVHFELPGASAAAAALARPQDAKTGGFWDRAVSQTADLPDVTEKIPWYYQIFLPWWFGTAPKNTTYTAYPTGSK
jgi:D-alanyl-D-alanine carboxypeptidase